MSATLLMNLHCLECPKRWEALWRFLLIAISFFCMVLLFYGFLFDEISQGLLTDPDGPIGESN